MGVGSEISIRSRAASVDGLKSIPANVSVGAARPSPDSSVLDELRDGSFCGAARRFSKHSEQ